MQLSGCDREAGISNHKCFYAAIMFGHHICILHITIEWFDDGIKSQYKPLLNATKNYMQNAKTKTDWNWINKSLMILHEHKQCFSFIFIFCHISYLCVFICFQWFLLYSNACCVYLLHKQSTISSWQMQ